MTLTRQAGGDLQRLQDRTGQSATDLVNRAISFRALADAHARAGRDLLVRDPETGEVQIIHLL